MIEAELVALLACPNCEDRPSLKLVGERLVCDVCNRYYPIVDGIPHLLPEDAQPLDATTD